MFGQALSFRNDQIHANETRRYHFLPFILAKWKRPERHVESDLVQAVGGNDDQNFTCRLAQKALFSFTSQKP